MVILLTLLVGTRAYNGGGMDVIERIFEEGVVRPEAFLLKMIFTSITIGAGFKGGEIVPTLFIGATLGGTLALLVGLSPAFGAAIGIAALFCGVTNCPVTSILIAFELFWFPGTFRIICWLWRSAMQYPDITGCIKTRRSCTQNIRRNM